ncbi:MAG: hypothetical protein ACKPKT_17785 [Dolichospermum sp.]
MLRSSQLNIAPMHPKDFAKLYGKKFAANISGIPEGTLSKYLAHENSVRYLEPSRSVKLHFGAIHKIIIASELFCQES